MTIRVNKQEAEKQFAHLISQVMNGEEIIISVGDVEVARILPTKKIKQELIVEEESQRRIPGLLKGVDCRVWGVEDIL